MRGFLGTLRLARLGSPPCQLYRRYGAFGARKFACSSFRSAGIPLSIEASLAAEQELDADILLVEDDPNDAELVRRALKRAGAVASIAHVQDGAEALDYLYARGSYASRAGHAQPRLMLLISSCRS